MSGRGGASVGWLVTVTIMGVFSATFLITTIIFLGQLNGAKQTITQIEADQADYITSSERQMDDVSRYVSKARKERQSLVRYMIDSQQTIMQRVTGSRNDDAQALDDRLSSIPDAQSVSMLRLVQNLRSEIDNLKTARDQADDARKAAETKRDELTARVGQIEDDFNQRIVSLEAQINQNQRDVQTYRTGTDDVRADFLKQLDASVQQRRDLDAELSGRITQQRNRILELEDLIRRLRRQASKESLKPVDEYALIDGQVIGTNPTAGQVTINRGRSQKLVLGMTFSVYDERAGLRPNADGSYPRGKAGLEVINIGQSSATCRVLWETQGNPLIRGDSIANPLYDPSKIYKFVVFGSFDANADGRHTPNERTEVSALIQQWGGNVVNDLSGDVDFLVLGQRPVLPPAPPPDAQVEVILAWQRLDQMVAEYDRLFKTAQDTSIPVLNENRLYTLVGRLGS